ncbi:MAG: VapE family protein [Prevotella sp.]|nr:VapE family protein [Prevotella sp.]
MKVTVMKPKGKKETIVRMEIEDVVRNISDSNYAAEVRNLREIYPFLTQCRQEDGRIESDFHQSAPLPMLCFALEMQNMNGERRTLSYTGLVVLEANNLADYDMAISLRNAAARMPQTLMAFVGASGRSVKIVCRGELYPDSKGSDKSGSKANGTTGGKAGGNAPTLPTDMDEIRRFHRVLYQTARTTYNSQLGITLDTTIPIPERITYMSADPDMAYSPLAIPFYIDTAKDSAPKPAVGDNDRLQNRLMPGRTAKRSYQLNFLFIIDSVLGKYFELPDEDRVAQMVMQIAAKCLKEGIPQAMAQEMTLCHPVLNGDELLVRKTFDTVYAVANTEDYYKRHKTKPLASVSEDALLMMKTDIFLNSNYEMRKNVMTGVAQYRDKNGEDEEFHDLDNEIRNEMTMRAKELGLKSWDKDIARFIDSPRIKMYDPVNDWLDHLPRWDGRDRIAELAARVPCSNRNWEKYLRTWMMGMTAHWMGRSSLTGNALTPLLIGRQGCGKSSFCRILLPPELRDYYNDRINFKNETDLNLGLTSFALINIDEFDKTTDRQQVVLKYLLSTADVKFRPPYGKTYKQYRRYASFIATTNNKVPLTDPTGSRRFICVEVTGNIDYSDTLNHRQIFAQLKQQVENGGRYWLNDEETAQLSKENERFRRVNTLEELIAQMFEKPSSPDNGEWLTSTSVLERLTGRYGSAVSSTTVSRVGTVLNNNFDFDKKCPKGITKYFMAER